MSNTGNLLEEIRPVGSVLLLLGMTSSLLRTKTWASLWQVVWSHRVAQKMGDIFLRCIEV